MTDSLASENPVSEPVAEDVRELILQADLICFPIGSFYSSVVASLLPDGVGKAVAANPCPKVFVPNPIGDPELLGHTVVEQVELLRSYLVAGGAPDGLSVLQIVLVDSRADYPGGLNISELESIGVEVMDVQLITDDTTPMFSPSLLAKTLISLVD